MKKKSVSPNGILIVIHVISIKVDNLEESEDNTVLVIRFLQEIGFTSINTPDKRHFYGKTSRESMLFLRCKSSTVSSKHGSFTLFNKSESLEIPIEEGSAYYIGDPNPDGVVEVFGRGQKLKDWEFTCQACQADPPRLLPQSK